MKVLMSQTASRKRRADRWEEVQKSLSPEELTHLDATHRTVSDRGLQPTSKAGLEMCVRWFAEFMAHLHKDVDVKAQFYTIGAQLPDTTIMKQYARYLVRTRTGTLSATLSVKTVQHYLEVLFAEMRRESQFPYHPFAAVRADVRNFISNVLAPEENLRTIMHEKGVAHAEDLSLVLSQLYKPEYLATFANMRTVLNLTLYLLLVVDLCGRGGEIAQNPTRPEHMCLRWEDVRFFSFQSQDDVSFDIRAEVKVRWSKGSAGDESKFKKIPFAGLLPRSMVLQDSLRLLLNLALMDGIFPDNVRTWDHLARLRLPANVAQSGREILLRKDRGMLPVLRPLLEESEDREVSTKPVKTCRLQPLITRLGKACGFQGRFTAYSLRRGVAYALESNASELDRLFLMGHYSSRQSMPYKSKVSSVDFPAVYRGLESRSVQPQTSISLNRSADAPLTISDVGRQRIADSKEVRSALNHLDSVRDSLKDNFPSIAAAKRAGDPIYHDYESAYVEYRAIVNSMTKKLYQEEYQDHFEQVSNDFLNILGELSQRCDSDIVGGLQAFTDDTDDDADQFFVEDETIQAELDADSVGIQTSESSPEPSTSNYDGKKPMRSRNRAHVRGVSTFNDMVADMARTETDAELSELMMTWFSVRHSIDMFPSGQEPLPGTWLCQFCGKSLSDFEGAAHKHTFTCSKAQADRDSAALLQREYPLSRQCEYQLCGSEENFGRFVACLQVFDTQEERAEHIRSHMRGMRKKDAHGNWAMTCFFGDCAQVPDRLRRDGPDFDTEEDRIAHFWEAHKICHHKGSTVHYCEFCYDWLIEPYEWRSHANRHMDSVWPIISAHGYCGLQVGREIVPRICPFCYHNEDLPVWQRIWTYSREGFPKHVLDHFEPTEGFVGRCPSYPTNCSTSARLNSTQMRAHLENNHEFSFPKRASRKALSDVTNAGPSSNKKVKNA